MATEAVDHTPEESVLSLMERNKASRDTISGEFKQPHEVTSSLIKSGTQVPSDAGLDTVCTDFKGDAGVTEGISFLESPSIAKDVIGQPFIEQEKCQADDDMSSQTGTEKPENLKKQADEIGIDTKQNEIIDEAENVVEKGDGNHKAGDVAEACLPPLKIEELSIHLEEEEILKKGISEHVDEKENDHPLEENSEIEIKNKETKEETAEHETKEVRTDDNENKGATSQSRHFAANNDIDSCAERITDICQQNESTHDVSDTLSTSNKKSTGGNPSEEVEEKEPENCSGSLNQNKALDSATLVVETKYDQEQIMHKTVEEHSLIEEASLVLQNDQEMSSGIEFTIKDKLDEPSMVSNSDLPGAEKAKMQAGKKLEETSNAASTQGNTKPPNVNELIGYTTLNDEIPEKNDGITSLVTKEEEVHFQNFDTRENLEIVSDYVSEANVEGSLEEEGQTKFIVESCNTTGNENVKGETVKHEDNTSISEDSSYNPVIAGEEVNIEAVTISAPEHTNEKASKGEASPEEKYVQQDENEVEETETRLKTISEDNIATISSEFHETITNAEADSEIQSQKESSEAEKEEEALNVSGTEDGTPKEKDLSSNEISEKIEPAEIENPQRSAENLQRTHSKEKDTILLEGENVEEAYDVECTEKATEEKASSGFEEKNSETESEIFGRTAILKIPLSEKALDEENRDIGENPVIVDEVISSDAVSIDALEWNNEKDSESAKNSEERYLPQGEMGQTGTSTIISELKDATVSKESTETIANVKEDVSIRSHKENEAKENELNETNGTEIEDGTPEEKVEATVVSEKDTNISSEFTETTTNAKEDMSIQNERYEENGKELIATDGAEVENVGTSKEESEAINLSQKEFNEKTEQAEFEAPCNKAENTEVTHSTEKETILVAGEQLEKAVNVQSDRQVPEEEEASKCEQKHVKIESEVCERTTEFKYPPVEEAISGGNRDDNDNTVGEEVIKAVTFNASEENNESVEDSYLQKDEKETEKVGTHSKATSEVNLATISSESTETIVNAKEETSIQSLKESNDTKEKELIATDGTEIGRDETPEEKVEAVVISEKDATISSELTENTKITKEDPSIQRQKKSFETEVNELKETDGADIENDGTSEEKVEAINPLSEEMNGKTENAEFEVTSSKSENVEESNSVKEMIVVVGEEQEKPVNVVSQREVPEEEEASRCEQKVEIESEVQERTTALEYPHGEGAISTEKIDNDDNLATADEEVIRATTFNFPEQNNESPEESYLQQDEKETEKTSTIISESKDATTSKESTEAASDAKEDVSIHSHEENVEAKEKELKEINNAETKKDGTPEEKVEATVVSQKDATIFSEFTETTINDGEHVSIQNQEERYEENLKELMATDAIEAENGGESEETGEAISLSQKEFNERTEHAEFEAKSSKAENTKASDPAEEENILMTGEELEKAVDVEFGKQVPQEEEASKCEQKNVEIDSEVQERTIMLEYPHGEGAIPTEKIDDDHLAIADEEVIKAPTFNSLEQNNESLEESYLQQDEKETEQTCKIISELKDATVSKEPTEAVADAKEDASIQSHEENIEAKEKEHNETDGAEIKKDGTAEEQVEATVISQKDATTFIEFTEATTNVKEHISIQNQEERFEKKVKEPVATDAIETENGEKSKETGEVINLSQKEFNERTERAEFEAPSSKAENTKASDSAEEKTILVTREELERAVDVEFGKQVPEEEEASKSEQKNVETDSEAQERTIMLEYPHGEGAISTEKIDDDNLAIADEEVIKAATFNSLEQNNESLVESYLQQDEKETEQTCKIISELKDATVSEESTEAVADTKEDASIQSQEENIEAKKKEHNETDGAEIKRDGIPEEKVETTVISQKDATTVSEFTEATTNVKEHMSIQNQEERFKDKVKEPAVTDAIDTKYGGKSEETGEAIVLSEKEFNKRTEHAEFEAPSSKAESTKASDSGKEETILVAGEDLDKAIVEFEKQVPEEEEASKFEQKHVEIDSEVQERAVMLKYPHGEGAISMEKTANDNNLAIADDEVIKAAAFNSPEQNNESLEECYLQQDEKETEKTSTLISESKDATISNESIEALADAKEEASIQSHEENREAKEKELEEINSAEIEKDGSPEQDEATVISQKDATVFSEFTEAPTNVKEHTSILNQEERYEEKVEELIATDAIENENGKKSEEKGEAITLSQKEFNEKTEHAGFEAPSSKAENTKTSDLAEQETILVAGEEVEKAVDVEFEKQVPKEEKQVEIDSEVCERTTVLEYPPVEETISGGNRYNSDNLAIAGEEVINATRFSSPEKNEKETENIEINSTVASEANFASTSSEFKETIANDNKDTLTQSQNESNDTNEKELVETDGTEKEKDGTREEKVKAIVISAGDATISSEFTETTDTSKEDTSIGSQKESYETKVDELNATDGAETEKDGTSEERVEAINPPSNEKTENAETQALSGKAENLETSQLTENEATVAAGKKLEEVLNVESQRQIHEEEGESKSEQMNIEIEPEVCERTAESEYPPVEGAISMANKHNDDTPAMAGEEVIKDGVNFDTLEPNTENQSPEKSLQEDGNETDKKETILIMISEEKDAAVSSAFTETIANGKEKTSTQSQNESHKAEHKDPEATDVSSDKIDGTQEGKDDKINISPTKVNEEAECAESKMLSSDVENSKTDNLVEQEPIIVMEEIPYAESKRQVSEKGVSISEEKHIEVDSEMGERTAVVENPLVEKTNSPEQISNETEIYIEKLEKTQELASDNKSHLPDEEKNIQVEKKEKDDMQNSTITSDSKEKSAQATIEKESSTACLEGTEQNLEAINEQETLESQGLSPGLASSAKEKDDGGDSFHKDEDGERNSELADFVEKNDNGAVKHKDDQEQVVQSINDEENFQHTSHINEPEASPEGINAMTSAETKATSLSEVVAKRELEIGEILDNNIRESEIIEEEDSEKQIGNKNFEERDVAEQAETNADDTSQTDESPSATLTNIMVKEVEYPKANDKNHLPEEKQENDKSSLERGDEHDKNFEFNKADESSGTDITKTVDDGDHETEQNGKNHIELKTPYVGQANLHTNDSSVAENLPVAEKEEMQRNESQEETDSSCNVISLETEAPDGLTEESITPEEGLIGSTEESIKKDETYKDEDNKEYLQQDDNKDLYSQLNEADALIEEARVSEEDVIESPQENVKKEEIPKDSIKCIPQEDNASLASQEFAERDQVNDCQNSDESQEIFEEPEIAGPHESSAQTGEPDEIPRTTISMSPVKTEEGLQDENENITPRKDLTEEKREDDESSLDTTEAKDGSDDSVKDDLINNKSTSKGEEDSEQEMQKHAPLDVSEQLSTTAATETEDGTLHQNLEEVGVTQNDEDIADNKEEGTKDDGVMTVENVEIKQDSEVIVEASDVNQTIKDELKEIKPITTYTEGEILEKKLEGEDIIDDAEGETEQKSINGVEVVSKSAGIFEESVNELTMEENTTPDIHSESTVEETASSYKETEIEDKPQDKVLEEKITKVDINTELQVPEDENLKKKQSVEPSEETAYDESTVRVSKVENHDIVQKNEVDEDTNKGIVKEITATNDNFDLPVKETTEEEHLQKNKQVEYSSNNLDKKVKDSRSKSAENTEAGASVEVEESQKLKVSEEEIHPKDNIESIVAISSLQPQNIEHITGKEEATIDNKNYASEHEVASKTYFEFTELQEEQEREGLNPAFQREPPPKELLQSTDNMETNASTINISDFGNNIEEASTATEKVDEVGEPQIEREAPTTENKDEKAVPTKETTVCNTVDSSLEESSSIQSKDTDSLTGEVQIINENPVIGPSSYSSTEVPGSTQQIDVTKKEDTPTNSEEIPASAYPDIDTIKEVDSDNCLDKEEHLAAGAETLKKEETGDRVNEKEIFLSRTLGDKSRVSYEGLKDNEQASGEGSEAAALKENFADISEVSLAGSAAVEQTLTEDESLFHQQTEAHAINNSETVIDEYSESDTSSRKLEFVSEALPIEQSNETVSEFEQIKCEKNQDNDEDKSLEPIKQKLQESKEGDQHMEEEVEQKSTEAEVSLKETANRDETVNLNEEVQNQVSGLDGFETLKESKENENVEKELHTVPAEDKRDNEMDMSSPIYTENKKEMDLNAQTKTMELEIQQAETKGDEASTGSVHQSEQKAVPIIEMTLCDLVDSSLKKSSAIQPKDTDPLTGEDKIINENPAIGPSSYSNTEIPGVTQQIEVTQNEDTPTNSEEISAPANTEIEITKEVDSENCLNKQRHLVIDHQYIPKDAETLKKEEIGGLVNEKEISLSKTLGDESLKDNEQASVGGGKDAVVKENFPNESEVSLIENAVVEQPLTEDQSSHQQIEVNEINNSEAVIEEYFVPDASIRKLEFVSEAPRMELSNETVFGFDQIKHEKAQDHDANRSLEPTKQDLRESEEGDQHIKEEVEQKSEAEVGFKETDNRDETVKGVNLDDEVYKQVSNVGGFETVEEFKEEKNAERELPSIPVEDKRDEEATTAEIAIQQAESSEEETLAGKAVDADTIKDEGYKKPADSTTISSNEELNEAIKEKFVEEDDNCNEKLKDTTSEEEKIETHLEKLETDHKPKEVSSPTSDEVTLHAVEVEAGQQYNLATDGRENIKVESKEDQEKKGFDVIDEFKHHDVEEQQAGEAREASETESQFKGMGAVLPHDHQPPCPIEPSKEEIKSDTILVEGLSPENNVLFSATPESSSLPLEPELKDVDDHGQIQECEETGQGLDEVRGDEEKLIYQDLREDEVVNSIEQIVQEEKSDRTTPYTLITKDEKLETEIDTTAQTELEFLKTEPKISEDACLGQEEVEDIVKTEPQDGAKDKTKEAYGSILKSDSEAQTTSIETLQEKIPEEQKLTPSDALLEKEEDKAISTANEALLIDEPEINEVILESQHDKDVQNEIPQQVNEKQSATFDEIKEEIKEASEVPYADSQGFKTLKGAERSVDQDLLKDKSEEQQNNISSDALPSSEHETTNTDKSLQEHVKEKEAESDQNPEDSCQSKGIEGISMLKVEPYKPETSVIGLEINSGSQETKTFEEEARDAEYAPVSDTISNTADPVERSSHPTTDTSEEACEPISEIRSCEVPAESEEIETKEKQPKGLVTSLILEKDQSTKEADAIETTQAQKEIQDSEDGQTVLPIQEMDKEISKEHEQEEEEANVDKTTAKEVGDNEMFNETEKDDAGEATGKMIGTEQSISEKLHQADADNQTTIDTFPNDPDGKNVKGGTTVHLEKQVNETISESATYSKAIHYEEKSLDATIEEKKFQAENIATTETMDATGRKDIPQATEQEAVDEAVLSRPICAAEISGVKGLDQAADKGIKDNEEGTNNDTRQLHSAKISLFDMMQRSTRERLENKKEMIEVKEETKVEQEAIKCEKEKSEEEKEDNEDEEGDDHKKTDSGSEAPVMVEASHEMDTKVAHKKHHHNILSGVGSKVKQSISKVKKAITGKSSHPKEHSPKAQNK